MSRHFQTTVALLTALALCTSGCEPTEPAPDVADTGPDVVNVFTCELGAPTDSGGVAPFGATATAELALGFQGLLFVTVRARIEGDTPPAQVDCHMGLRLDDVPYGSVQPQTDIQVTDTGEHVSSDILIFLDGGSPEPYIGKEVTISSRLVAPGGSCVAEATVQLVDEDPCIHTGEEPICPGDEVQP